MNAITIGKPKEFLKGMVRAKFIEPETGNILGYDEFLSEGSTALDQNIEEIAAGLGNKLIGVLTDTTRLTGTITSRAFSLEQRQLITGGALSYNATANVCETVTAVGSTLTVTGTPVKHRAQPSSDTTAWCYVREHNASEWAGTNYRVDLSTKQVLDYIATNGEQYDVFYNVQSASALELAIPSNLDKKVVTIELEYGRFSMQNDSSTHSTFVGWSNLIIPRAILTGDGGMTGSQTESSPTSYTWTALAPNTSTIACGVCNPQSAYAYIINVPCGDPTVAVEELATIGGGITLEVGATKQFPVVYVMPDGSPVTPTYTDLTYVSAATGTATVSAAGVIEGVAAGDTTVTATLEKSDGTTLTTVCNVTVTA